MISVSVIIPVYNVEKYIAECLESLLGQSYPALEFLFVDDCGQDSSIQIIEAFLSKHTELNGRIIHHERNKGLSGARNTGLGAATGDYVFFLDSDDILSQDAISIMVNAIEQEGTDIIVGGYEVFGDRILNSDLHLPDGYYSGKEIMKTYSEGKWYVMAWNKLCRKGFLLDNELFFEERLIHEDQIWSFKAALKADSMQIVNAVTYRYRVRQSSIMTGMGINKDALSYVKVYDALHSFIMKEHEAMTADAYNLYEGKRSGILYSILEKNEKQLYKDIYHLFRHQCIISPIEAYRKSIIGVKNLVRDIHYCLPETLGCTYKHLFYLIYYRLRKRKIEGAVWE